MQNRKAGLEELFRLYVLSRALPAILSILKELVETYLADNNNDNNDNTGDNNNNNDSNNDSY